ncbi:MAG: hypothetical protein IT364_26705 [Candidatus Hydrogenedentes bacterium]|nr:hypothetical protein [Candidatus Hydrogenedentota bacterium]
MKTCIPGVMLWGLASAALIADVTDSPNSDRLWFTLGVQSPIASGSDYTHRFHSAIPKELAGTPIPPLELRLEFRQLTDHLTVAFVPFEPLDGYETFPAGISTSEMKTRGEHKKRLAGLPPGEYQVAVVQGQNRIRISNVATFTIDPKFHVDELPVLSPVPIEPPPHRAIPGVALRIAGSKELLEPFLLSEAVYCRLVLDDVELDPQMIAWTGPDPEIHAGDRFVVVIPTESYLIPELDPASPHSLQVRVKSHTSAIVPIDLSGPLGTAWDRETRPFPKVQRDEEAVQGRN